MLFSELVQPQESDARSLAPTPTLKNEPEDRHQLKAAERAIRMVKRGDQAGAEDYLTEQGLQWVRKEDFWILAPTDLAVIQPVTFPSRRA